MGQEEDVHQSRARYLVCEVPQTQGRRSADRAPLVLRQMERF